MLKFGQLFHPNYSTVVRIKEYKIFKKYQQHQSPQFIRGCQTYLRTWNFLSKNPGEKTDIETTPKKIKYVLCVAGKGQPKAKPVLKKFD